MPFRLLRTAVFAGVCLGLGWGAHVFAGGAVSPGAMAGALGAAFAVAYPLSGRERTFGAILPLLGGLQVAMHVAFSLAHAASPIEVMAHVHSGLVPGLGMLVAHAWATGLTALWLARGEALFWALLRRLAVRLLALRLLASWTPLLAPPGRVEPPVLRPAVLRYAVSRRGPPRAIEFA
ncbi:MFS transporter [Nonomuraea lactucae]|uniref:MFS transporter n=1 Tax=Nonomuraea lactucae TaxID=2249762 RepID=UPI0013B45ECE|nr:MFS transporter [Nonomuraea lactucae]